MRTRKPKNQLAQYSGAYKCIKPEEVDQMKYYSFSFNPIHQPLFDRWYNVKINTLLHWSDEQKELLTTLRHCTISVVMEISSKGRLHYHGIIQITNIVEFYINDLPRLRDKGSYEIDHITDPVIWNKYVHKQERFMKEYAEKNDMDYEITNMQ